MSRNQSALEECCDLITDGTHHSPPTSSSGPYLYVTSKNVRPGRLELADVSYVTEAVHQEIYNRCPVQLGDVLYVKDGANAGTAALNTISRPYSLLSSVAVIRPRRDVLDSRYLLHWLNDERTKSVLLGAMSGSAIRRLVLRDIRRFVVPLPSLGEQRRIADILDKADAIRRKRKEAIALTEELLRSAFLDMFGDPVTNPKGWPTAAIEDLASSDRNALAIGPFGSNLLASDYTKSGHPVVFVRDLVTERFVWKSDVFVSTQKFEELAAHHAEPGDVLATKMGTPPGIASVVPKGFPRAVVTADVVKVSVDRAKVFPDYLAAAINSSWGRQQIAGITAGVTRAKITLRDFRGVQVRLPELERQRRYVNYVGQVMGAGERQNAAIRDAEDLFNSLVARAFSGALST